MKNKLFARRSPSEAIAHVIVFCIFAVFAFTYVYLIFWCFISGLRTHQAIGENAFGFGELNFKNYIDIFEKLEVHDTNFVGMFINSMYFAFGGPLLCILVTSMFAYVTSKYKFFGAGAVYFIVLVVITLPVYGTQSATYKLLHNLQIINTRWMILTSLNGFSIYYMYFYAFYKGVSWSYAEAAQIDGANDWQIYFKVMFPQALTMVGSLFLMLWITDWNNYSTALIYLREMPTLAVGIYQFKSRAIRDGINLLYAASFVSLLPPLILFMLCNNALMSNVSLGGIKE